VSATSVGCAVFLGNEDKVFVMFVSRAPEDSGFATYYLHDTLHRLGTISI
jgi:hypothetical protein